MNRREVKDRHFEASISAETADEIKNDAKQDAQKDACGEWEVECYVLPPENYITGQLSEKGDLVREEQQETSREQDRTEDDQPLAEIRHC
jgi:hypothetical protein